VTTDVKEKLVELLDEIQRNGNDFCDVDFCGMRIPDIISNEEIADRLISKGVVVHEWISVLDRRPVDNVDTDESRGWGCVEVYSPTQGVDVASTSWVNEFVNDITHWRPLPQPPRNVSK
jgi:hypothetical protein